MFADPSPPEPLATQSSNATWPPSRVLDDHAIDEPDDRRRVRRRPSPIVVVPAIEGPLVPSWLRPSASFVRPAADVELLRDSGAVGKRAILI
jgi:hypothetical protein